MKLLCGRALLPPQEDVGDAASTTARSANHTTECSSMWTARPAARPPDPFFELRAHPFDMLLPCLIFLDGDGPADPLVARERGYVFPSRQCLRIRRDRLSEISRKVMYDSSGDSNSCHRASLEIFTILNGIHSIAHTYKKIRVRLLSLHFSKS